MDQSLSPDNSASHTECTELHTPSKALRQQVERDWRLPHKRYAAPFDQASYGAFQITLYFTLPCNENSPTHRLEFAVIPLVPSNVCTKFIFPPFFSCFWKRRLPTSWMSMPEAAIDEDSKAITGQRKVRGSRKVSPMNTVTKPIPMNRFSQKNFRLGVETTHRSHDARANSRSYGVTQRVLLAVETKLRSTRPRLRHTQEVSEQHHRSTLKGMSVRVIPPYR